jgi:hypothetical protein
LTVSALGEQGETLKFKALEILAYFENNCKLMGLGKQ